MRRGFHCTSCNNEKASVTVTPEWISTMDIQLQDTEKFNNIERLPTKFFEQDTIDVRAGEIVSVIGDIDVTRKNEGNGSGKYINMFCSGSIEYARRDKVELTDQAIQDIERWKNEQGSNLLGALVESFAPIVVGHQFVKKSLLIAVANAGIRNNDSRAPPRLRIHVLVVGDPSQAKSVMIKKISELLPNGRFESAVGSSGIGLTFTVTKEPNESYVLRLGAIPLASGSVCAINEMNQTPLEQQKHYFDFMEEGQSTSGKYAIPATIVGYTTIIGSANPRLGRWKNQDSEKIELDEISLLPQVIDRFDIICILKEGVPNEQKDREYIRRKKQIREDINAGKYNGYDEHLKKYLMYARTFNPNAEISDEAINMLDEYWIKMGQTVTDDRGRPRKQDALYRMAVAISKLKLKNQADIEDAIDTMQHYNFVVLHFGRIVPVSQSPKEVTRQTCIDILREHPYPIAFTPDLITIACERKEQISLYIGDDLRMRSNRRLREVYEELCHSEHVTLTQEKPAVFKWKGEGEGKGKEQEEEENVKLKVKADEQPCDTSDLCDKVGEGGGKQTRKENKHNEESFNENETPTPVPNLSHIAHMSHSNSIYADLITEEHLSSLNRTVYRCKEHPEIPYYDLAGIEESHFKPDHNNDNPGNVQ